MKSGLIDADVGDFLYKKQLLARSGAGKLGGFRTLPFADALTKALRSGMLLEMHYEQDD